VNVLYGNSTAVRLAYSIRASCKQDYHRERHHVLHIQVPHLVLFAKPLLSDHIRDIYMYTAAFLLLKSQGSCRGQLGVLILDPTLSLMHAHASGSIWSGTRDSHSDDILASKASGLLHGPVPDGVRRRIERPEEESQSSATSQ